MLQGRNIAGVKGMLKGRDVAEVKVTKVMKVTKVKKEKLSEINYG